MGFPLRGRHCNSLKRDSFQRHGPTRTGTAIAAPAFTRCIDLHLHTKTVVGCEKALADQQDYEVGHVEVGEDLAFPTSTRSDLAIVPFDDTPGVFQGCQ